MPLTFYIPSGSAQRGSWDSELLKKPKAGHKKERDEAKENQKEEKAVAKVETAGHSVLEGEQAGENAVLEGERAGENAVESAGGKMTGNEQASN